MKLVWAPVLVLLVLWASRQKIKLINMLLYMAKGANSSSEMIVYLIKK